MREKNPKPEDGAEKKKKKARFLERKNRSGCAGCRSPQ